MREAKAQHAWKRRTEQLVAFGMGLHRRLGGAGGGGVEQGGGELSFNIVGPISVMNLIEQPRFVFHGMTRIDSGHLQAGGRSLRSEHANLKGSLSRGKFGIVRGCAVPLSIYMYSTRRSEIRSQGPVQPS